MKKIPIGILGATGVIGEEYLRLLKNHPWFEMTFLAGSEKRIGATSSIGLKINDIEDITTAKQKCAFLFSALPNAIAEIVEEKYAKEGLSLLSHASCHRMKDEIPLIIPEINAHHLSLIDMQRKQRQGFIVAKPNCAIISFLLPLAPLHTRFGIKKISVTTLQAISGAGNSGLSAYDIQDNIIPFISGEEEKSEQEPLKILGDSSIIISSQCNRVPTLHGHFACVSCAFSQKPDREEILKIWREFPGLNLPSAPKWPLYYCAEEARPQTRYDVYKENGMSVSIGRLRPCSLFDYRFTALSHNAIRGGAGGGVLIAELLHSKGYI